MATETLQDVVESTDDLLERFRNTDYESEEWQWSFPDKPYSYPDEFTHWIEEQRAWRESCVLMDQSYHLATLAIRGPEAVEFCAAMGTNGLAEFRTAAPPQAKHQPLCGHDGSLVGDCILFYLAEDLVVAAGGGTIPENWLEYNLRTREYDAAVETRYTPYDPGTPAQFRFEIQGPEAVGLVEEIADGPLPDVGFFEVGETTIEGVDVYALGHGMASSPGLELFGPYEAHDRIEEAILAAGEDRGLRRMGYRTYFTAGTSSGWIGLPTPAIYHGEAMADYRRWLPADSIEATLSIGGSYAGEDLTDYYIDPFEMGYGHMVHFDHEFVGREALEEMEGEPHRQKVTFVWNDADVVGVYGSLFEGGEPYHYLDMPSALYRSDALHFDEVRKGGETVGISTKTGYNYNQRESLSLGLIEPEYADPGTEVRVVWGETDTEKRSIERHAETEIRATVAPAPYVGGREDL